MKFVSDHYFHIGHEHVISGTPCQDHALSFSEDKRAGAIVSDGCSSGKETDMGARIITFSTLQAMKSVHEGEYKFAETIKKTSQQKRSEASELLGLTREDLLATRLSLYVNEEEIFVHLEGDGVIVVKYGDGSSSLYRYDWAENTPCYPAYDEDAFVSFIENQASYEQQGLTETLCEINDGTRVISENLIPLEEGIHGVTKQFVHKEGRPISLVAIISDGVTRIDGLDWVLAVEAILSFKNIHGQFVKRRLLRLQKEWAKKGIVPQDDIALGVVATYYEGENHDTHQE